MFAERLKELMSYTDIGVQELSVRSGVDRTNISHFRSGKRVPKYAGETLKKLADTVSECAYEKGTLKSLGQLIEADADELYEKGGLSKAVMIWLCSDEENIDSDFDDDRSVEEKGQTFAGKLDLSMKLAGITNTKLSRMINVDPSLISRYRLGGRIPKAGSDIVNLMAHAILRATECSGQIQLLCSYIGKEQSEIDEEVFAQWLVASENSEKKDMFELRELMKAFDLYSAESGQAFPELSDSDISSEKKSFYEGDDGLRDAVIWLLGEALKHGGKELCLYSDQSMDWMVTDRDFSLKWAALMSSCVKKGIKIKIIHNVDRNMGELSEAIKKWLPLYMSGMIESWYINKKKDRIFTHTIFLCDGVGCVEATHVSGNEKSGFYHIHADVQHIGHFRDHFDALLKQAKPFVTLRKSDQSTTTLEWKSVRGFKNIEHYMGNSYVEIRNINAPGLIIRMDHPIMCRAFAAYDKQLEQS